MIFRWQNTGQAQTVGGFLSWLGCGKHGLRRIKRIGQCQIQEHPVRLNAIFEKGQWLTLILPDELADPQVASSQHPLTVLWENQNWLAVNKPIRLASVPGPQVGTDHVVSRTKGYGVAKPHLVTRLDFDTSGVLLIAKHGFGQTLLAAARFHPLLEKQYLAWVAGMLPAQGKITLPLGHGPTDYRQQVLATGQRAETQYQRLAYSSHLQASLVQIRLLTGRTHQIRAHFAALGHPLLGDALYEGPLDRGIQRPALHAVQLSFQDPFELIQRHLQAPLPDDLRQLKNHA
jgi:23S rRNA pseudouridine1911/1915/1917 synthase